MKLDQVFFGNGVGNRIQQEFDRDYLKLGQKVFATLGPAGEITKVEKTATNDAQPYWVGWIAPSEWYVALQPAFTVPDFFVDRITEALGSLISEKDIRSSMNRLQSLSRPEHQHKTSEWERNPLSVIFTVLERLDLLEKVNGVRNALTPMHHEELASYLMLTCFDRLGQPVEWVDFGTWLTSSQKKGERDAAVSAITESDTLAATAALHSAYNKIYGVKNSFFQFVLQMISDKARLELFNSIEIIKVKNPPQIGELPAPTDQEKLKYLFKRRNDYTHRAAFSPPCGPKLARVKSNRVQEYKLEHWETTNVLDWPGVLERTVRDGLASFIRQYAD